MAPALSPVPQNRSPRTGPLIAPPVSWATTSRRIGVRCEALLRFEPDRDAEREKARSTARLRSGRQYHPFRADRTVAGDLAKKHIGRVLAAQRRAVFRVRRSSSRGSPPSSPSRAAARRGRSTGGRPRHRACRCCRHSRPGQCRPRAAAPGPSPGFRERTRRPGHRPTAAPALARQARHPRSRRG